MQRAPEHSTESYRGLGQPVSGSAEGLRADLYLARYFPFKSRGEWREVCDRGHLLVNGLPVRASRRLNVGDKLAHYHPPDAEPQVDVDVRVLAERSGILAVLKPGNLPMHESGLYWRKTLSTWVADNHGSEWHPVHRLDRETSGVVMYASTPSLRKLLSDQFVEHRVTKTYVAIVAGEASWDELVVDAPIGLDESTFYPRGCVREGGAYAVTALRVLERKSGATLIEAKPRTGRFNQIRIHLAAVGLPIVGDKLYGPDQAVFHAYHEHGDSEYVQGMAGARRHCLHAASVAFRHPESGELVEFSAPVPGDMLARWSGEVID